jgi:protein SCO1/2
MARFGVILLVLLAAACHQGPAAREYRVVGQIISINADEARLTLRHEDIEGFMPAMTMPYPVKDRRLLEGRKAGELVNATLDVQGADAWISRLTVTGVAPLPPREPMQASLARGDLLPDATFTDQDGRSLRMHDLRGRPIVISFVYTRCPFADFCPAIETRLAAVQRRIKIEAGLTGTAIVTVSIDPAHDTPAVLKRHATERGVDTTVWRLVTGPVADVDGFGRQFGVSVTRGSGAPADIEHNLRTIIVGRDLRIERIEEGAAWRLEDLLPSLQRAAGGS